MSQTTEHTAPPITAGTVDATAAASMRKVGGLVGILGAVVMLSSAVMMFSGGSDWLTAAQERTLGAFLTDVTNHSTLMYVHLAMWIAGATLMALSSSLFASSSPISAAALTSRFAATAGAGAVLVLFPLVIGVIYGFGGHPDQDLAATAMTQAATVADDVATVMIMGVGATLAVVAGRGTWAPGWLVRIAAVNGVVAALYFIPIEPVGVITSTLLVLTGETLVVAMGIVGLRERASRGAR
jgi:hypothetical protein